MSAALALTLFCVDPTGLGGIRVRGWPGPARDALLRHARELLPTTAPIARIPVHVAEDRLLGGLSLAATLREGRIVSEQGILARLDGGVAVVAMAERIAPNVAAHLCGALDRSTVNVERDGITSADACRIGIIALDEGIDDEHVPTSLLDRLAFWIDLPSNMLALEADAASVASARARLDELAVDDDVIEALCGAARSLGIESLRAVILAANAARAHAALAGRSSLSDEDVTVAAALVLGPRATCVPSEAETEPEREQEPPPETDASPPESTPPPAEGQLEDRVVEAAKSGIPAGLLDDLVAGREPRSRAKSRGVAGAAHASMHGGRPAGTRPGMPREGERLDLVETLRAAAPWQRLRGRSLGRVLVRKDDFRIKRFQERRESSVIFCVDASGSAALQRLGEAKGAVEQVLVDCYARRDHVALVAFRGSVASTLLPPTRALARVRRSLADLAGGGTTPLATGIDAALSLAVDARRRGQTPVIVVMTDGRANVARDGQAENAAADALASAKSVRDADVRTLFLDTSQRPRPQARAIADAMAARYLPLPYLDSASIARHVHSLAREAS